ncbi:hypothetical protein [Paracoccus sp. (in: a-proteobacteria)]|uniref:hypothetical protein n=1 Tax=Paracoccus sp. TaxID=267 RepID=UPI002AFDCA8E|nr:hypothetical protein [Paracoccus sp. (in: a-proteobacteria)]
MKISLNQFVEFSYGDKRKDKSKVADIINDLDVPYDPAKDRYKQFREAMKSFEDGKASLKEFQELYETVSANKSSGYRTLSKNYLNMKEDYALIWEGRSPIEAVISDLHITTAWYLRTEENNQRRIIFLHFGKDPFSREKERGILTLLRMAKPDSAGVGIMNIQPGTLVTATRLDEKEAGFLRKRAERFTAIAKSIQSGR